MMGLALNEYYINAIDDPNISSIKIAIYDPETLDKLKTITDEDIYSDGFFFMEGLIEGSSLSIGGICLPEIKVDIRNDGFYYLNKPCRVYQEIKIIEQNLSERFEYYTFLAGKVIYQEVSDDRSKITLTIGTGLDLNRTCNNIFDSNPPTTVQDIYDKLMTNLGYNPVTTDAYYGEGCEIRYTASAGWKKKTVGEILLSITEVYGAFLKYVKQIEDNIEKFDIVNSFDLVKIPNTEGLINNCLPLNNENGYLKYPMNPQQAQEERPAIYPLWFPIGSPDEWLHSINFNFPFYIEATYRDDFMELYDAIVYVDKNNDTYFVPDGANINKGKIYSIEDNFVFAQLKDKPDADQLLQNLLSFVKNGNGDSFRRITADVPFLPSLESGDVVRIATIDGKELVLPILNFSANGQSRMRSTISSDVTLEV